LDQLQVYLSKQYTVQLVTNYMLDQIEKGPQAGSRALVS